MKQSSFVCKLSFFILFFAFSVIQFVPSFAQAATEKNSEKILQLQARGDREIDRRISPLSLLAGKIDKISKLTAEQKASYIAEINDNIYELQTLRNKIDVDTDLAVLKKDLANVTAAYSIYAVYIPKVRLLVCVDRVDATNNVLTGVETSLEEKITAQKTAGKDVVGAEALVKDMKTKLASAKVKSAALSSSLIDIVPSGYPGNKGSFQTAKSDLSAIRNLLSEAKKDAADAWTILKPNETK
jgi:hypothetical protein